MWQPFKRSICLLLSAVMFLTGACYPNSDTCNFCPPPTDCSGGHGGIQNECLCNDGTPRDDQFVSGGSGMSFCVASDTSNSYFYPAADIYKRTIPSVSPCASGTIGCCSDGNYHNSNWYGNSGPLMHGQCVSMQGIRYCARVTVPAQYGRPTPKETPIQQNKPMMCGFEDPQDFNDDDPLYMPFQLHTSSGDLPDSTASDIATGAGFAMLIPGVGYLYAVGALIAAGIAALVAAVKAYINYVSYPAFDCIPIPTAPSPPPFPASFVTTQMSPIVYRMCSTTDAPNPSVCGLNVPLTTSAVQGPSNFFNPLVRVQMGETFPICSNNTYQPGVNCAVIVAPGGGGSLSGYNGDIASFCPMVQSASSAMDPSWYGSISSIAAPCVQLYHTNPGSLYPQPSATSQVLLKFSSAGVPSGIELNFATFDGSSQPLLYPSQGSLYDNIANLPIGLQAAISNTNSMQVCVQNVTAKTSIGCVARPAATISLTACPSSTAIYPAADGTMKQCISTPQTPRALLTILGGAAPITAVVEPDQPILVNNEITFFPYLTNETGIVPSYQMTTSFLPSASSEYGQLKSFMGGYSLNMLPLTADGTSLTSQSSFTLPDVTSSNNAVANYWAQPGASAASFANAIKGFQLPSGLQYGKAIPPALVLENTTPTPTIQPGTYMSGATRLCLANTAPDLPNMTSHMLVSLFNYSIVLVPNYKAGSTISYPGRVDPSLPPPAVATPAQLALFSTMINSNTESLQSSSNYCVDITQPTPPADSQGASSGGGSAGGSGSADPQRRRAGGP